MTQPAKSQEPSMEEILASIRRIIADDNAGKKAERVPEAPVAPEALAAREAFVRPAAPPRPSFLAPPEPSVPEIHAEATAGPAATGGAEEDQSSEILDLTESMTAREFGQPEPAAAPSPAPDLMSQFEEPEPAPQLQEPEAPSLFKDTAPTPIYPLSLPDPLPILLPLAPQFRAGNAQRGL